MIDAPTVAPGPPQALPDFDLILFGGTGDLAMRKLLPGLYRRHVSGDMAAGARIIGVARTALTREEFVAQAEQSCRKRVGAEFDASQLAGLRCAPDYLRVDATAHADYAALAATLAPRDGRRPRLLPLDGARAVRGRSAANCKAAGVADAGVPGRAREAARIGHRAPPSASTKWSAASFEEHQIFRIDHYLGKETVQNLIALRFGNALFEPLWRRDRIDHVQITVAETAGRRGTRADFYDRTGALRDMVQNHLLQLLCIIAMEPPVSSDADAVRDEKLKVLRALRPIDRRRCAAQHRARPVPGGRHRRPARAGLSRGTRRRARQRDRDVRGAAAWTSTTGAGPACRSTCAPASACRSARGDRGHVRAGAAFDLRRRGLDAAAESPRDPAAARRAHHAAHPGEETRRGDAPEAGGPGAGPRRFVQVSGSSTPTSDC